MPDFYFRHDFAPADQIAATPSGEDSTTDLDVEAVLGESHSTLTASICADQKLWRTISRARQSGSRDRMNLALDAYIIRSESIFGGQQ